MTVGEAEKLLQLYLPVEKQCLQLFNQDLAANTALLTERYCNAVFMVLSIVSGCIKRCWKPAGVATAQPATEQPTVAEQIAQSGGHLAGFA